MRYLYILFCLLSTYAVAQPIEQRIKVIVAPDHSDWTYKQTEKAKFTITVLQDGNPLKDVKVRWEYGPEKMEVIRKDSSVLKTGTQVVDAGGMKSPGFLRCTAWAR